jgi:hypothetical protein
VAKRYAKSWLVVDLDAANNPITSFRAILHAHWNTNLDVGINLIVWQGLTAAGHVCHLFPITIAYWPTSFATKAEPGENSVMVPVVVVVVVVVSV